MSKEEVIIYLSETYKTELYKTLALSGIAGFLGGVFNCAIQRKFVKVTGDRSANYVRLAIDYISSGLFFGLGSTVVTYLFFMSYSNWTMKTIEIIKQFSITLAIISPTMLTIIVEIINENIFRRDED